MKNVNDFFQKTLKIYMLNCLFFKTWEYDECWLFCVDPVETIQREFTTLYNFRARWSIPTRRKPIPRFTASVYFTFDVSKIKPKVRLQK
jgi:A-kinase anchor protein 14